MARRYARDNRGRFASSGTGATARGGRLKTASGKKRATQTMQASAAPKGTIGKPRGLKPGAIKAKPQVSSARQAATDRLKIKTETRRKLRTDRASVIPATPKGPKTMKAARPQSTVAKQRTKGNTKAQVASRVERKIAVNRANLAAITRAERTGARQGKQYERALKRGMTLERAQNFLQTGRLPGRDNSMAAQRNMRQAKDRLAAKNATRAVAARMGTRPDMAVTNIPMRGSRGRRLDAEISRNVAQQKAASRSASKAANRKFKSDQSRAKKLREVHEKAVVGKYSAKMGKTASEVRSAIRSMEPAKQVKFFRQFVKENRATAAKTKRV